MAEQDNLITPNIWESIVNNPSDNLDPYFNNMDVYVDDSEGGTK